MVLEENKRVRNSIPELIQPLMPLHLEKVDEAVSPGLTILRWSSLDTDKYINNIYKVLKVLEELVLRTSNSIGRINEDLAAITNTTLVRLPTDPWTPGEFIKSITVSTYQFQCCFIHSL